MTPAVLLPNEAK